MAFGQRALEGVVALTRKKRTSFGHKAAGKAKTAAARGGIDYLDLIGLTSLGVIATVLMYGWVTMFPTWSVPLLAGVCLGLAAKDRTEALAVGLTTGVLAPFISLAIYPGFKLDALVRQLPAWASSHTPADGLYRLVVLPILSHSAFLAAEPPTRSPALMAVIGAVLLPASCLGVWYATSRAQWAHTRAIAAAVCAAFLMGLFAYAALVTGSGFIQAAKYEPSAGEYRSDTWINIATFYGMQQGSDFYTAYVRGHAGVQGSPFPIEGDNFVTLAPSMMRQPATFLLWQALAFGGRADIILYWAVVLAALVLGLLVWSLGEVIGARALFLLPVLTPITILLGNGFNAFLPDWWALLSMLASVALLVRRKVWLALGFGLLAMLFRETTGLWLAAVAVALSWAAVRSEESRGQAIAAWAVLVGGIAAFLAHTMLAGRHVIRINQGGVLTYLAANSGQGLDLKFFAPILYASLPYVLVWAPTGYLGLGVAGAMRLFSTIVPIGIAGWWVALRRCTVARLSVVGYMAVYTAYLLTIGGSGQYWGQLLTPLALIGLTLLLACLRDVVNPESWKLGPADRLEQA